ncbi:hypothetical protein [Tunturibacter empetritectus]|uniref:Uncharacterized protein n=1 Tax=Tunturiibacter lichenicola TaxID=2051959 RepID=A0A7W8N585_9BACT|nr:hypothetical protein [Edaphobacter lichenicola]MBB5345979.1 hypothetical protein [Edaphobacter lichenicola]
MADTASAQLQTADDDREAPIRPVIAIGWSHDPTKVVTEKLYIRNVGSGVAVDVGWKRVWSATESAIMYEAYLKTRPDRPELFAADGVHVRTFQDHTLTVSYESLSGRKYESEVKIGEGVPGKSIAELTLQFREVRN